MKRAPGSPLGAFLLGPRFACKFPTIAQAQSEPTSNTHLQRPSLFAPRPLLQAYGSNKIPPGGRSAGPRNAPSQIKPRPGGFARAEQKRPQPLDPPDEAPVSPPAPACPRNPGAIGGAPSRIATGRKHRRI